MIINEALQNFFGGKVLSYETKGRKMAFSMFETSCMTNLFKWYDSYHESHYAQETLPHVLTSNISSANANRLSTFSFRDITIPRSQQIQHDTNANFHVMYPTLYVKICFANQHLNHFP